MEYFSTEFMNTMNELKSERFQNGFRNCVHEIDKYIETEEEKRRIHMSIEANMRLAEKGNMICPYCLFRGSDFENQDEAIKFVVEDVTGRYMFDENILEATIVVMCLHFNGISLADKTLKALPVVIGINYVEQGRPVPEIIICENAKDSDLGNGYKIYWMK